MMKKLFAVLIAVLMIGSIFPAFSFAAQIVDSGFCGEGVTWALDEEGLLTISGAGNMDNYYNELYSSGAPWSSTGENALRVKKLVVENGVTSIGSEAFLSCGNLESVRLPGSVVSIGTMAFCNCSAMSELEIGEGVKKIGGKAFFGCAALTSLTIPDSVTLIGSSAFHGCAGLTEISIGHGLTFIGDSVFWGCTSLQSIVIPEGITEISPYAFYGCFALMDVTLPDSLATVGANAFGGCGKLHILCNKDSAALTYALENGLAYGLADGSAEENVIAGNYNGMDWRIDKKNCVLTLTVNGAMPSFTNSKAVPWAQDVNKNYVHTAIVTPGATSIGNMAFYGCDALTAVTIPSGVTSVGSAAFNNCSMLPEIQLPDSVTYVGPFAFHGCAALTDVSMGSGLQTIGANAFSGCSDLPAVVIPNGVTVISDSTFKDCLRLKGIVIPGSVTTVGADAFNGSGLTEAVLPSSVRTVQSRAFANCVSLYSVTFYSTRCTFGDDVVPAGTVIYGYRNSDVMAYADANDLDFLEIGGAHEHEFIVIKTVPATCARTGLNTLACSCGAQKLEVLPRTDVHVQGEAERTLITPATCVAAGEERITVSCTVCGKVLVDDTYEVPATGIHTPGEAVETVLSSATCTATGRQRICVECTVCGQTLWEKEVEIPTLPHKDENGDQRCDVCGSKILQPCEYCGKIHDDTAMGRLIKFFHSIIYFFQRIFGR